ncbi:hypothetical protein [Nocardioides pakistanensis]
MKKTRIVARIIAGAAASALLLTGIATAPAQADSGWNQIKTIKKDTGTVKQLRDSGWNPI